MDLKSRSVAIIACAMFLFLAGARDVLAQPGIVVVDADSTQLEALNRPDALIALGPVEAIRIVVDASQSLQSEALNRPDALIALGPAEAIRIVVNASKSFIRTSVDTSPADFGQKPAARIKVASAAGLKRAALIEPIISSSPCTLNLNLSYASGSLTIGFDLGTTEPTFWNTWLLSNAKITPLWGIPLATPIELVSFDLPPAPFPPIGKIGFLTALTTAEGVICADWEIIDTKVTSGQTPTGFYWPTGTSDLGGFARWLADSCSWSGNDDYLDDSYHIGWDIDANENDPVYAITDGEVVHISPNGWGDTNIGVLVKHELIDGSQFIAVYGHVHSDVQKGDILQAGEPFATIGPFSPSHIHFGVRPGVSLDDPYGAMPCPEESPITDTNGFVDPIDWILTQTPLHVAVSGASIRNLRELFSKPNELLHKD